MSLARPSTAPPIVGCTPLFDAAALRDADRRAGEQLAMPSILLMERAGLATAEAILARFPAAGAALVLVGKGNNGGDGMVVARHLAEAGWEVRVEAPGGEAPATGDGAAMAAIAAALGIAVAPFAPADPPPGAVVVDALLGTGAHGAPRGEVGRAVAWAAECGAPVVSCDLPSGVEADSGRVAGPAVRADLTVTYHGDLVGLRVMPGRAHAGEVEVADIGIPGAVRLDPAAWLAGAGAVAAIPPKGLGSDKYGSGSLLVVAGSRGLIGAACLASRAGLRAGAGLCVLATPEAVQPAASAQLLEVMCAAIPDEDGHFAALSLEPVLFQARRAGAVAIGPGLGRKQATGEFLEGLLAELALPAVLDADALWHLEDEPERLAGRRAATVLTPHAGEAARLLGRERAEVEGDRLACARELAARSGAVVVLKGSGTLSAAPDGTVVVDAGGTPALATAGSGDVLTGAVGALLAKGLDPLVAAAAAVAAHGRAGVLAGRGDGTIASDVLEALPAAISTA